MLSIIDQISFKKSIFFAVFFGFPEEFTNERQRENDAGGSSCSLLEELNNHCVKQ